MFTTADAVWSPGQNDGAGKQSRTSAEELDQRGNIENHVVRIPVLHRLTVEHGFNRK